MNVESLSCLQSLIAYSHKNYSWKHTDLQGKA